MHCAECSCAGCSEIRKVVVKDNGQPVPNLNELEYIKGEIWANVYQVLSLISCSWKMSCRAELFCWELSGGYFFLVVYVSGYVLNSVFDFADRVYCKNCTAGWESNWLASHAWVEVIWPHSLSNVNMFISHFFFVLHISLAGVCSLLETSGVAHLLWKKFISYWMSFPHFLYIEEQLILFLKNCRSALLAQGVRVSDYPSELFITHGLLCPVHLHWCHCVCRD